VSIEDLEARIVDVERKYETLRLAVLEWGKGFDTHGRLIDKLWQRIEALDDTQRVRSSTPKPDIIPKPQFPPPRIIREDFLP
jgi:hypothetical protein